MGIGRKRIGLDFDCILANTTEAWVNLYNRYVNGNLEIDNITEWNISKFVPEKHKGIIMDLLFNKRLWESIQPLPDSQYYTSLLCKDYDVYVITNTHWKTYKAKVEWLIKQYPYIDTNNIIVTSKKQMIDVDLLVDDYEMNLISGSYNKVLLNYPWNKNVNDKEHGIVRAYDWKGIYDAVHTLLPVD